MIKKLKIVGIFLLLTLSSCGFQTIYGTKDVNFIISEIKLSGNDDINNKIVNRFNFYKNNDNYSKIFDVEVNSSLNKEISSKDRKGNAKTYKLSLKIKIDIFENNKLIKTKIFNKNSNYKSIDNKFDLNQYEKNLANNLINDIWQDIEITLNSL